MVCTPDQTIRVFNKNQMGGVCLLTSFIFSADGTLMNTLKRRCMYVCIYVCGTHEG
jgi:hypothetical protein